MSFSCCRMLRNLLKHSSSSSSVPPSPLPVIYSSILSVKTLILRHKKKYTAIKTYFKMAYLSTHTPFYKSSSADHFCH
jgi:hypothetical protein